MEYNGNGLIITCFGDVVASDTHYTLSKGIGSKMQNLKEHYLGLEKKLFIGSDVVFCNLESPLTNNPSGLHLPFAGNPAMIHLMEVLGINVVSIANNHMLDHGEKGVNHTISLLEENGFNYIGLKEDIISKITLINCKNRKIA